MKRIIKGLYLFILVILSITIIYPTNVEALSNQTSYINIDDNTKSLTVGNLTFSNITFKNYSSISTQAIGLTGSISNSSGENIDYSSVIDYYDSNYNLIAQGYNSGTAIPGANTFNQMSNISILKDHNADEIHYYRLSIDTKIGLLPEENIESNIPSKNYRYKSYDYVIDKYDINIIVNENNTLDITETITAYFNVAKHGIFRTIPLKNEITRLDGTTSKNRTQITNLSVDNEYTTSREEGNYKIQIGSASRTLVGEQSYVIKYTYNLGKDPVKDYDELYYNIIGSDWDTAIGNVTFTISMPKDFDSSKLGFSSGEVGSTDNRNVKYNVVGNKITGSYDGILDIGEALTVRCELDEGYFVGAGLVINIMDYIVFLIPIIFLGISILIWYKFGRDEQVIETVEFYPPEGFNSLEVGFLYKGKADNQDVTSLLIYLANKGYIKISEIEEKSLFSKSSGFKITKLKKYDGNNINEKIFLNGLFKKKPSIDSWFDQEEDNSKKDNINEVTSSDLYDNFYITMYEILSSINTKENKNKIFEKSASGKSIFIVLMIIISYCSITIPPILIYGVPELLIVALLFPGIGFTVLFCTLFGKSQTIYVNGKPSNSSIAPKIFGLIWGGVFGGVPWAFSVLPALLLDPLYLIGYIIGVICILGMAISLKYLPKRTKYGNEILGKLRGFKNFLETAEKDRLEAIVTKDPEYFYNILPYTYVLGVSDVWIKKFEKITLKAPSWYDSPNAFDAISFGTFINTTMTSAQSVMASSPSSSSSGGGGSSGGGSSGGGSGGGGGGSW